MDKLFRKPHNNRHKVTKPEPRVLSAVPSRTGEGWEVKDNTGRPIASGFDDRAEAERWIDAERSRLPGQGGQV